MSDELKNLFKEYVVLKSKHEEQGKMPEEMNKELLQKMVEEIGEENKIETELGTFSIGVRHNYIFPEYIISAENSLKEKKKVAIQSNEAEDVPTKYLLFRRKPNK